ncbi:MAG: alpha,6-mannosyltransferase, partial [Candidatus Binataceae bacterium]|nr:alpha,6-mannosyltransferase [Candidatus Binataceae bacterium]
MGRAPVESSGNNPRVNAPGDSIDAANDAPHPTAASSSAPEKLHHPDTSNSATEPVSVLTLCAVYALEVLAIAILRIPHELGLFMFAFGDRGSWLVVQYLVAHGYRPTIDFGFPYGLLPILFGRAWFAIFGLTPRAFDAAMVAGGLAMAFGMARFANAMRLNRVGQILVIVALPIAIQSGLPSLSHLLEAVLLCLAIGEHAQGNRGTALALTTAACFAKAALGYLYGFLLILLIVAACWRRDEANARARFDWIALRRTLMPAIITGLLLLAIVGAVFGARPLLASLLPLNGMKIYPSLHFGFFTPWSRTFWDPRVAPIGIYFATPAPFWLFSTIWLALAGLFAGWNLL